MKEHYADNKIATHRSLSYGQKSCTLLGEVPSINLDLTLSLDLTTMILSEKICALIAHNQPDNPIGLFKNPVNEVETQLCFINHPLNHTARLVELIEMMYESCNNPIYISTEINRGDMITAPLNSLIKRFYLPFNEGGIIDNERAEQHWIWNYSLGKTNNVDMLAHFAKHSNCFLINQRSQELTTEETKLLTLAGIQWQLTE